MPSNAVHCCVTAFPADTEVKFEAGLFAQENKFKKPKLT